ncbi:PREDICTED: uncharacterized protein LOC108619621 [Drosophila arizonae]|uniref:Uncharacterized protein LOC108619621 n=1 Tax=Drosophila arizonae TaxID=7263 RepID=A0ABM1PX54_DROAR|nr:PREDICTED: uncharacterized protein LOC108619621 [Drosophila arizonae]
MNPGGDRVKPSKAGSRRRTQTQIKERKEVEEILGMIYSESSAAGLSGNLISSETRILGRLETVTFPGRYVTRVLTVRPFEVTKRFVRPQITFSKGSEPNADSVLNKLFSITNLENLLLLITPTEEPSEKHIVHGFAIDGERHLGVTSLTTDEKDLLVYTQRPDNYTIVFCSSYVTLEDAFKKTEIRNRVFEITISRPTKPIIVNYDGDEVSLSIRLFKPRKELPPLPKKKKSSKAAQRSPQLSVDLASARGLRHRPRCSSMLQSNVMAKSLAANRMPLVETPDIGPLGRPKPSKTIIKANTEMQLGKNRALSHSRTHIEMSPPHPNQAPHIPIMLHKKGKARTQLQMSSGSRNEPMMCTHSEINTRMDYGRGRANMEFNSGASVDRNNAWQRNSPDDLRSKIMLDKSPARSCTASPQFCNNADNRPLNNKNYLAMRNDLGERPSVGKCSSLINVTKSREELVGRSQSNSAMTRRNSEEIVNSSRNDSIENRTQSLGPIKAGSDKLKKLFKNRTFSTLVSTRRRNSPDTFKNCNAKYRDDGDKKLKVLMKPRSKTPLFQDSSISSCRCLPQEDSVTVVSPPHSSVMMTDSGSSSGKAPGPTQAHSHISITSSDIGFRTPTAITSKEVIRERHYPLPSGDAAWSSPTSGRNDIESSIYSSSGNSSSRTDSPRFDVRIEDDYDDSLMSLSNLQRNEDRHGNTLHQEELRSVDGLPPPAPRKVADLPQPQAGNGNGNGPTVSAPKRRIFMTEIDKSKMLERERLWNCANPKHRAAFNDSTKRPRIARHVLQKKPSTVNDNIKVLYNPHPLQESDGDIFESTDVSTLNFETSQSIVTAKSSEFERVLEPVQVPEHYSARAHEHLKTKLRRMTAKQAFENLGKLVQKINSRSIPQNRQLLRFFRLAALLEIKMFVRLETYWGMPPTIDPRCRLDCYMFDDRNEFVLSMGLLCKQLNIFCELFPTVKENIRYVDNALQLTMMPRGLTDFLQTLMTTLGAEKIFKLLAEMIYEMMQPKATLLALAHANQTKINESDQTDQELVDPERNSILETEDALQKLNTELDTVALD